MRKKPIEETIYNFMKDAVEKVFGGSAGKLKLWPEEFLPRAVRKEMKSYLSLAAAERKVDPKVRENYRKSNRKKKAIRFQAEQEYFDELTSHLSYDVYPDLHGKLKINITKDTEVFFGNGIKVFQFDCFEKAQYLFYSAGRKTGMITMPKDKKIVKAAVKKYEEYIEGITEKLADYFATKSFDRIAAIRLAGQVIKDLKFKIVE